jgi:hypothetical protein
MMSEVSKERVKERLRQEQETFNQHKAQEQRWFSLRLIMGYSALVVMVLVSVFAIYIIVNNTHFPPTVVNIVSGALFIDVLGLLVSVWKIVFNPDFQTKLAPITQLGSSDVQGQLPNQSASSTSINTNDLTILDAKYGANNKWMDVKSTLTEKIQSGKLVVRVENDLFGPDPVAGIDKSLDVTYSFHGHTFSTNTKEHEMLVIP